MEVNFLESEEQMGQQAEGQGKKKKRQRPAGPRATSPSRRAEPGRLLADASTTGSNV